MSDPELDLECRHGARPKVAGPLTAQTIQEEARAAPTEEHALQLRGTDFYLPLGGQPRISEKKVLESSHCHRTWKPRYLRTNR